MCHLSLDVFLDGFIFFYHKRLKKLGVGVMRSNVPSLGGYIYIGVGVLWSIFLNLYIHLFYM